MAILKTNMVTLIVSTIALMTTLSVKADFKSEIIQSCTDYQQNIERTEVNACKLYIDGFIDASILSENAIIQSKNEMAQISQKSDFIKRVYQTRLINNSHVNKQLSYKFCIPKEYQRKKITSEIALAMQINHLHSKPLKQVLFETLVNKFPCNK